MDDSVTVSSDELLEFANHLAYLLDGYEDNIACVLAEPFDHGREVGIAVMDTEGRRKAWRLEASGGLDGLESVAAEAIEWFNCE